MNAVVFIIGVVISAIISALFSESILRGIALFLAKFDLPSQSSIEGIWEASFSMSDEHGVEKRYKEKIKIVKRLGNIYGYNVPDSNNHELLKTVESKKPLRIRGSVVDNRYFTGVWFHPSKKSRFHGSYQLLLNLSGDKMEGVWTGYRESSNCIESGNWLWNKS